MSRVVKLACRVTQRDVDVRSPRSFRRHIKAEFVMDHDDGGRGSLYVEGFLVRVMDGFAVESVDRDDLNVKPEEKAELLMDIHNEAGHSADFDPCEQTSYTDKFEITGRSSVLSVQSDQLLESEWT